MRRTHTGCGAPKNPELCAQVLTKLMDPTNPLQASRSTIGRAYALSAAILYDGRTPPGTQSMNADAVYRAAVYADKAAGVGFVPPIVFSIAQMIENTGFRRAEDCPRGFTVDRFVALTELWRVWDKRKEAVERATQRRDDRVQENRNRYFCAAEGCGIEGTRRSALPECKGQCSPEGKPSYCSKQCQKKASRLL